ncbi:MAG TPA: PadR family transcriptional regulator [Phycisphaerae bacterium]|nr:PadR family transcriptional regulator [Phycisphaerae bacterium]
MPPDPELIRGTLNTILLEIVSRRPMYGYEICKSANTRTQGYFDLREGSLYPALHRLEREGLLKAYWEVTEAGRRRKYYRITEEGLRALIQKREDWKRFATAVEQVLATMGTQSPALPEINPAVTM